jgi:hypothetical protein
MPRRQCHSPDPLLPRQSAEPFAAAKGCAQDKTVHDNNLWRSTEDLLAPHPQATAQAKLAAQSGTTQLSESRWHAFSGRLLCCLLAPFLLAAFTR